MEGQEKKSWWEKFKGWVFAFAAGAVALGAAILGFFMLRRDDASKEEIAKEKEQGRLEGELQDAQQKADEQHDKKVEDIEAEHKNNVKDIKDSTTVENEKLRKLYESKDDAGLLREVEKELGEDI